MPLLYQIIILRYLDKSDLDVLLCFLPLDILSVRMSVIALTENYFPFSFK